MALQKAYSDLNNDYASSYWKSVNLQVCTFSKRLIGYDLHGYKNADARQALKPIVGNIHYEVSIQEWENVCVPEMEGKEGLDAIIAACYAHAKTKAEFSSAIDV